MVEYLKTLPRQAREGIIEILYDDACHFKKFSEDNKRAAKNDITDFMANKVGKHVDKFHFPNHVDAWCHANCNPADVKHLHGVNTPICEQLFSAINKYTNTKSMNEAHFFLFFLYIFDLHNLHIEGKLRSVANPSSEYRYAMISESKVDARNMNDQIDDVDNMMKDLAVDVPDEVVITDDVPVSSGAKQSEFVCKECNAKYKKEGMLKLHVKKKHPEAIWENMAPKTKCCKVCSIPFEDENDLKKHLSTHFKCTSCGTPFDDQKYLNRHIKVNHTPITCEVCGLECSDRERYSVHMKTHLNCDRCGKTFEKQHQYKRHMKSHL